MIEGSQTPGRKEAVAGASQRWRRTVLAAVALMSVFACGDPFFTASVTGRRPFEPPAVYRDWWSQTELCARRSASFDRISWYLADGLSGDGLVARGRWSPPHDIIIVASYEANSDVVRHEMLHDLLDGDPARAAPEWERCQLLP